MIAEDGQQALQLANEHAGKIDLLLSDVQMPGLTGPDLANELERSRPYLKVVLMSGCPSPSGAFERDWRYLQKPFQLNELLEEVRVVLRGTSLDQGALADSSSSTITGVTNASGSSVKTEPCT